MHAFPDDPMHMAIEQRRDSFCGKMSVCNNLRQYGIPFSLTTQHTSDPENASFQADLRAFAAMCRLVRGLRRVWYRTHRRTSGQLHDRALQRKAQPEGAGISVETLDLSDVFGRIDRLRAGDDAVTARQRAIERYSNSGCSRSGNDEDGQAQYRDRRVVCGQPD